jgi:hypothetical protein
MQESRDDQPEYEYVAYIDESGDPGLTRVKPLNKNGSSEWLIVSAVVVSRDREQEINGWLADVTTRFKNHHAKALHFAKLNPAKKRAYCEDIASRPVRCFVVASNKKNMRGYENPFAERVSLDKNWFYCWLTRLLLERVTHWVDGHSRKNFGEPKKVKLVYSTRGGLSYSQLNAYFELLKMKSIGGDTFLPLGDLYWDVLSRRQVEIRPHYELGGLQLADAVASAFFKACDKYDTGACNPEFAKLLAPRMARVEDSGRTQISGYGLKLMPGFKKAKLEPDQQEIFRFYGYPAQWWDPNSSNP